HGSYGGQLLMSRSQPHQRRRLTRGALLLRATAAAACVAIGGSWRGPLEVSPTGLAFGAPRGFASSDSGTQKRKEDTENDAEQGGLVLDTEVVGGAAPTKPSQASMPRPSSGLAAPGQPDLRLNVIIVGGGAIGLWLAVQLAAGLWEGKLARVRVYESRWKKDSEGKLCWREEWTRDAERLQVASLPGELWSKLPDVVK
ncbi:unnamed protein product, partial [Polarella glacialis]